MLLQQGLPDTTIYMIAGYAVIFGVMSAYLASLWIRRHNLARDLRVLQEMEQES
jgi:hypothetical protein